MAAGSLVLGIRQPKKVFVFKQPGANLEKGFTTYCMFVLYFTVFGPLLQQYNICLYMDYCYIATTPLSIWTTATSSVCIVFVPLLQHMSLYGLQLYNISL